MRQHSRATFYLIGSRTVLADAMRETGIQIKLPVVAPGDINDTDRAGPSLLDWPGIDASGFERGRAKADNGRYMLDLLTLGAQLTQRA